METFNEKASCKKCGCTDIATTYCEGGYYKGRFHSKKKHLDRYCRRCSFNWEESCLM